MDTKPSSQPWFSENKSDLVRRVPFNYSNLTEISDEEKVIKEVAKILAAANRRAILVVSVTIAVTAAIFFKMSQTPPNYTGKFQLLVEPLTISESNLRAILSQTIKQTSGFNGKEFSLDYASQIRVLKSPKVMEPIIDDIKKKYKDVNASLANSIRIERPKDGAEPTRILEVSYSDENPKKVKFILDKVAQAYLRYSLENRQTELRQGIDFIENQLPVLRKRVDTLQEQLQRLRQEHNVLLPEFQGRQVATYMISIDQMEVETQAQLSSKRQQYANLKELFSQGKFVAVLSQNAGAYNQLIRQIHELDAQVEAAVARWQEDHPTLQSLREQQENFYRRAREESQGVLDGVAGEVRQLEAREQSLFQARLRLEQEKEVLASVERQYDALQLELQAATNTLTQFLDKLGGLKVDAAQQESTWQLISPPTVTQSAGSGIKTKALVVIFALALGIGAGVLAEILNNVFHTAEDLADETGLPLIGTIPFVKEFRKTRGRSTVPSKVFVPTGSLGLDPSARSRNLVAGNGSTSLLFHTSPVAVEAFRSLYTNIRLLSPDRPFRALVISAATPGEGKSTVALHLAQTAATIGQRVLLVDADLRNPKIHKKLNLPNLQGLSDAIVKDLNLNEAIQRSPEDDNLFVLTSGRVANDPIKLLSSQKMHSLMEQFQDFFDLVIYDTPPLVGLADASILLERTDGLILIVKLHKSDRSLVFKALDGLKIYGGSILGVVANGMKT